MDSDGVVGASFKDPSGFVFRRNGCVYRQVNQSYAPILAQVEASGLYRELVDAHLLVEHEDVDVAPPGPGSAARILLPQQVPFVSYPYEWCFGQIKDAALATLEIQSRALRYGMSLKDASAFNIQFIAGTPVLIDTLSFEPYDEGQPWVAYRQFCEHFLAPLLLTRHVDPWLTRLAALTADGIPLDIASKLLPWTTRMRPTCLLHIHLHARSIKRYGGHRVPDRLKARGLNRRGMDNLVDGLRHTVQKISWQAVGTEWADYEDAHGYSPETMDAKSRWVDRIVASEAPEVVWDLGANTGSFSRLAASSGAEVVSVDFDPAAVERNYQRMREHGESNLHPVCIDLRNPSPALGWAEEEREGLASRSNADIVLALALVHHLRIGANVPFNRMLSWFARLGQGVVVEFVPKEDPQAQRLLVSRDDVFEDYTRETFERALGEWFRVIDRQELPGSGRVLYHGVRRG